MTNNEKNDVAMSRADRSPAALLDPGGLAAIPPF